LVRPHPPDLETLNRINTMSKSEELKGQTLLVRTLAATLDIKVPDEREKRFRATALRKASAEIKDYPPALTIRLYESACGVDFPDPDVTAFRHVCQTILAKSLDLEQFKATTTKA
jgi:hypothetical protein